MAKLMRDVSVLLAYTYTFLTLTTTASFENGKVYSIRSTTSALIFGLQNGTSVSNIPITSQEGVTSEEPARCKQNWRAVESTVNPGFFYIRGEQGGSDTPIVWSLEGNSLYHKPEAGMQEQRWEFDQLCGAASGLIRNQKSNHLCLQDNGLDAIISAEECDVTNGAMLWKIYPVDSC